MTQPSPLRLVVDTMIPFAREAFSHLGAVTLLPGRAITRETVRDADALIVRSGITVNADLLAGSRVRFVGTATTGVDHVDRHYLADRNIAFAAAPGCNANAVAEYVLTALLATARRRGLILRGGAIGIIGVGRIGSLVARLARALDMRPILHDPPLARATGDPRYRPLREALRADVLTLHVPLTVDGPDPTWHLIGKDELARMSSAAILINTSRGAVVDNDALCAALARRAIGGAALDVWEEEPAINWDLLRRVILGTPHIAGHSVEGKVNGTVMIYHACCRFWGRQPVWQPPGHAAHHASAMRLAPEALLSLRPECGGDDFQTLAHDAATTWYDIYGDHARLMGLLDLPESMRPETFDQLRRNYPQRREFSASSIDIGHGNRKSGFKDLGCA